MITAKHIFQRTELLLGTEIMYEMTKKKVIIFGIGGVGSWCAESLIRSGITNLTIVDSDRICVTNINRQLPATTKTIGEVKTTVLKKRLLEINPDACITDIQKIYNQQNSDFFNLKQYDYIIDAIDSLGNKTHLIRQATRTDARLFSSMGASMKIDPSRIKVAEFWEVKGCPLGSKVRKRMRKGDLPAKEFLCVYSEEMLGFKVSQTYGGANEFLCPETMVNQADSENTYHEWSSRKAVINGTISHITAIFGFTLAGLVIQDIYRSKL